MGLGKLGLVTIRWRTDELDKLKKSAMSSTVHKRSKSELIFGGLHRVIWGVFGLGHLIKPCFH